MRRSSSSSLALFAPVPPTRMSNLSLVTLAAVGCWAVAKVARAARRADWAAPARRHVSVDDSEAGQQPQKRRGVAAASPAKAHTVATGVATSPATKAASRATAGPSNQSRMKLRGFQARTPASPMPLWKQEWVIKRRTRVGQQAGSKRTR